MARVKPSKEVPGTAENANVFLKEENIKVFPRTAGSLAGEKVLTDLIAPGNIPTLPTRGTAELTAVQQEAQARLGSVPGRISEATRLATDKFQSTLEGDRDPLTSPAFEGFRRLSGELKATEITEGQKAAGQQAGVRGVRALGVETNTSRRFDTQMFLANTRLSELAEHRKLEAAKGIQTAASQEVRGLTSVTAATDADRLVEQSRVNSLFEQAYGQITFLYEAVADIATNLMNFQQAAVLRGGGWKDEAFAAAIVRTYFRKKYGV